MVKVSQIMKTKNILVALIVLEFAVCVVLGIVAWNKQKELTSNAALSTTLMEQIGNLEKTTVPADDYNNLVRQVQSLKIAAGTMAMTPSQPMDKPDQICNAVKQILARQQQMLNSATAAVAAANAAAAAASSPTAEVDFLVTLVAKEITQQGVVDTQQTEKFTVILYHMQKVLDAIGYKLNATITTTNQAVLKFQADNQLKADGKIGLKTWAKISELWNAKRPGGPMPAPASAPAQAKPQTPSQTPAPAAKKPQSQSQAPAPVKPQSLSSVTTKSSVKP
jgi:hypothetical protein